MCILIYYQLSAKSIYGHICNWWFKERECKMKRIQSCCCWLSEHYSNRGVFFTSFPLVLLKFKKIQGRIQQSSSIFSPSQRSKRKSESNNILIRGNKLYCLSQNQFYIYSWSMTNLFIRGHHTNRNKPNFVFLKPHQGVGDKTISFVSFDDIYTSHRNCQNHYLVSYQTWFFAFL